MRAFSFFLSFKDLLHDCILTRQLSKCKQHQLSAAASLAAVTDCLSPITVDQHTSNLSRIIIRCIQRMKQAYVHVLIFTELTLYVERSLGCFAFIKFKKRSSFVFVNSSIGSVTLLSVSTMKGTKGRDPPKVGYWSVLQSESSYLRFGPLVCVFLELNTRGRKEPLKRYKMTEQPVFTPLHRFKYMEQWWH